eukprot:scaffold8986_cov81-Phaeocystis_antarctica.AAC.2
MGCMPLSTGPPDAYLRIAIAVLSRSGRGTWAQRMWFAGAARTLPKKGESLTRVCAAEAPPTYEKTGAGALVDMALDGGTRFRSPRDLRPTRPSLGRKSGSSVRMFLA